MLGRIGAVMVKEVRQLARDRLTFGLIVGIPLMQMLLFGYAINFDVRNLQAAVVDDAGTSLSRAYARAHPDARLTELAGVGHFEPIDPQARPWPTLLKLLDGGIE